MTVAATNATCEGCRGQALLEILYVIICKAVFFYRFFRPHMAFFIKKAQNSLFVRIFLPHVAFCLPHVAILAEKQLVR